MHKKQIVSVSIVIPVYNEADTIDACLQAIAAQTVRPYEVIVVDNNSTDATAAVARCYPFVKVLSEKRQGVVHARDTGFNAARGEIIGRIDADTIVSSDWVATVQRIFNDSSVDVVSGSARYNGMLLADTFGKLDLIVRGYLAAVLGREVAIQGANMALRRTVWLRTSPSLCRTGGIHEDYDIGIHANWSGFNVAYDPALIVTLHFRQARACFVAFRAYLNLSPHTYHFHGLKSARHMYLFVWLATACYLPIKLLHLACDPRTGQFSLAALLLSEPVRVNPGTFVD